MRKLMRGSLLRWRPVEVVVRGGLEDTWWGWHRGREQIENREVVKSTERWQHILWKWWRGSSWNPRAMSTWSYEPTYTKALVGTHMWTWRAGRMWAAKTCFWVSESNLTSNEWVACWRLTSPCRISKAKQLHCWLQSLMILWVNAVPACSRSDF